MGLISINVEAQTWSTYQETDQIKIEYSENECSPAGNDITAKFYVFKVTNKTANEISVSWNLQAYFNDQCRTCNNPEYNFTFVVSANGFVQGTCGVSANPALNIFKEWINNRHIKNNEKLTKFELINIRVQ